MRVGFIGVGVMGVPIARSILKGGFPVIAGARPGLIYVWSILRVWEGEAGVRVRLSGR